jgi:uncharacterized membrane protein YkoI
MNSRTKKGLIAAGVVAVLGVGGAAVAVGTDEFGDDDATQKSITGNALQKASDAALDYTGGGQVTETEVGDEESYYEVEVTRDDGSQIDVQLDRGFHVVGSNADHEDADGSKDD